MLNYALLASIAAVGIAFAGAVSSRHFIVAMLSAELMLFSSAVLLATLFAYSPAPGSDVFPMMIGIWSVAMAEAVAIMAFYVYVKSHGLGLDLSRISQQK